MRHIEVEYQDDTHAFVDDHGLEDLVRLGQIKKFHRPSERRWVTIGIDAVRSGRKSSYTGCERRRTGGYLEMTPVDRQKDARISC